MDPVLAMTTTSTEREAKHLASLFVRENVAACVQIISRIQSIYKWQGEIHDEQEYLLLIKTEDKRIKDLKKLIEKNHSYEVPEFIVLPIIDGSDTYFKWMQENTK